MIFPEDSDDFTSAASLPRPSSFSHYIHQIHTAASIVPPVFSLRSTNILTVVQEYSVSPLFVCVRLLVDHDCNLMLVLGMKVRASSLVLERELLKNGL